MAVWIGGVVSEIDLLRRACSNHIHLHEIQYRQERAGRYAELLRDTTKCERVETGILAGASAGGVNAILYGWPRAASPSWTRRAGHVDQERRNLGIVARERITNHLYTPSKATASVRR